MPYILIVLMQHILITDILYICTAEHLLTGMVTTSNAFVSNYSLCKELLSIINSDQYTVSMTLFEATEHNVTCAQVIYITHYKLCKEFLYKIGFDLYTVYVTRFDAT
jgi:hypothetical protein